jgi:hypothetical protein
VDGLAEMQEEKLFEVTLAGRAELGAGLGSLDAMTIHGDMELVPEGLEAELGIEAWLVRPEDERLTGAALEVAHDFFHHSAPEAQAAVMGIDDDRADQTRVPAATVHAHVEVESCCVGDGLVAEVEDEVLCSATRAKDLRKLVAKTPGLVGPKPVVELIDEIAELRTAQLSRSRRNSHRASASWRLLAGRFAKRGLESSFDVHRGLVRTIRFFHGIAELAKRILTRSGSALDWTRLALAALRGLTVFRSFGAGRGRSLALGPHTLQALEERRELGTLRRVHPRPTPGSELARIDSVLGLDGRDPIGRRPAQLFATHGRALVEDSVASP